MEGILKIRKKDGKKIFNIKAYTVNPQCTKNRIANVKNPLKHLKSCKKEVSYCSYSATVITQSYLHLHKKIIERGNCKCFLEVIVNYFQCVKILKIL